MIKKNSQLLYFFIFKNAGIRASEKCTCSCVRACVCGTKATLIYIYNTAIAAICTCKMRTTM